MKKYLIFKSLIVASLFLAPIILSCSNNNKNEVETKILYSQLPTKFNVIKTWFTVNPTIAPAPSADTKVEITEGDQIETDHSIGGHYYEIDIDNYLNGGVMYDVEFYLDKNIEIIAVVVNDIKVNIGNQYTVAETQLKIDYKQYTIGDVAWSTQRGYQIGTFTIATKAQSQSITAWYAVNGDMAIREMDSKDLGTTVPDKIKLAFEATKYSNTNLWIIDEIELEHNYNDNGLESYYEMELNNIQTPKLEAQLFFSYDTGELLYSKEELDNDNNDDDKFVINVQLKAAVELAAPGAQIIDAEIDDNLIEVEAIITTSGISREIELEFTMDYKLVSNKTETTYSYSLLPAKFEIIKTWFINNPTIAPAPNANTTVEVTEGIQSESDHNIGEFYYEVEIDDYDSGNTEYEVEFYLNKDLKIISVIVNDINYS